MLTADLVDARRVKKELHLIALKGERRERALELAEVFLQMASDQLGKTREEFEELLEGMEVLPHEKRLADGLIKLIEDQCEFDAPEDVDPSHLRKDLFVLASQRRAEGTLVVEELVGEVAKKHGMSTEDFRRSLYADLKGAHILKSVPVITARQLVSMYDDAQAQGVLLRAVKMTVAVRCASPEGYRRLFRRMKFLRLLAVVHQEKKGYVLEIDGPFSMFESTTRYGLSLAMLLPDLRACDHFELFADVRWGKERQPLTFRLEGGTPEVRQTEKDPLGHLPDEVRKLLDRLKELETAYEVSPNEQILNLPGVGVCVPDLVFVERKTKRKVFLEVLGFWSRDAVWKRVELVEQGLPEPVVFAVSERLRVSEQALDDGMSGALYVYKGMMNAHAVLERVEKLLHPKG